ncbi:MAG: hypothetical protein KDD44_07805, partial [Bdellovibrionales bacterium]|nr:hypothetical protein [Bdellovibrionales bacterium]
YWRGSAEVEQGLVTLLRRDGFEVIEVSSLEGVLDELERQKPAFLLVDGASGGKEVEARVKELGSTPKLFALPIIFFSADANSRILPIKRQFERLLAVDYPFKLETLLSNLAAFAPPAQAEGATKIEQPPGSGASELRKKQIKFAGGHRYVSSAGFQFAAANKLLFFDDKKLMPTETRVEVVRAEVDRITNADRWLGLHARRVAFLGSRVGELLELNKRHEDNVKTVGLVLNHCVVDEPREVQKLDILLPHNSELFERLVDCFKRSSEFVRESIGDEMALETVQIVVELLSERPVSGRPDLVRDAQCALAAEVADRACWSLDYWNPKGAHRVLRKLRMGVPFLPSEDVVTAVARVMSEAVLLDWRLTNAYGLSLNDEERDQRRRQLEEAMQEASHLFEGIEQEEIPLSNLASGMILTRPVVSRDGEVVISANVELDDDLIWRLWQLAGARPLEPTVLVAEPPAEGDDEENRG